MTTYYVTSIKREDSVKVEKKSRKAAGKHLFVHNNLNW